MFDPLEQVLTFVDMFFVTSFKIRASLTYITPITIGYFINHVRLIFNRRSEFGRKISCCNWFLRAYLQLECHAFEEFLLVLA